MPDIPTDYIYLDYAASAPLCVEASDALSPYLYGGRDNVLTGANANSLSRPGRLAFKEMQGYRKAMAQLLGCRPDELVFTSGATEADNAAITGIAKGALSERAKAAAGTIAPSIVTTPIEHDAVLAPIRALSKEGFDVRTVAVDANGSVDPEELARLIDDGTVLVSIQMANSEIGTVQDIGTLARIAHDAGALFHTDATQALGKCAIDLGALGVDAASFSAHKIGGPKGVGALFLKNRTPFKAHMLGGGQERGLRSGTQNVMGIAGFCAALEASVGALDEERARLSSLRDRLYDAYRRTDGITPTVDITQDPDRFLPNIASATFDDLESETLILRFDSLGFAVSGGSACSSMSLDPSHVLTSIGIPKDVALCALRVSMGRYTTDADIDAFIAAIPKVLHW